MLPYGDRTFLPPRRFRRSQRLPVRQAPIHYRRAHRETATASHGGRGPTLPLSHDGLTEGGHFYRLGRSRSIGVHGSLTVRLHNTETYDRTGFPGLGSCMLVSKSTSSRLKGIQLPALSA